VGAGLRNRKKYIKYIKYIKCLELAALFIEDGVGWETRDQCILVGDEDEWTPKENGQMTSTLNPLGPP